MRQDEGDGVDIDEKDAGRELEVEECKAFTVTLEAVAGEDRESFKYKKVANKTKPVATTLPEVFRIMRRSPSDALADLPALPTDLPQFVPMGRYMQERHDDLDLNLEGFLWPAEEVLAHKVV